MITVTGQQMQKVDNFAIHNIGIPGIVLMENAAQQITKHIKEYIGGIRPANKPPYEVIIIAGKGNNAGDGFAVARQLFISGIRVAVYCLFDSSSYKGDALTNFEILEKLAVDIFPLNDSDETLKTHLQMAYVTVDAIFGTGFKGVITGEICGVVDLINEFSNHTLSIDISSGINSETGAVSKCCIKAHKTVTFELPKIGQLVYPGAEYTGELAVESIGMPKAAILASGSKTHFVDMSLVSALIRQRPQNSNKGTFGKAILITGSEGMAGAGCIAAKSCLRAGAGLVYLAVPQSMMSIYQSVVPEAIAIPIKHEYTVYSGGNAINQDKITIDETNRSELFEAGLADKDVNLDKNLKDLIDRINNCTALAIGPGMSTEEQSAQLLRSISQQCKIPVVMDADALNIAAMDNSIFSNFTNDVIITPHPGEMSRLTGLSISEIQSDRISVAREFAMKWGINVVLKGARTIVADKYGNTYINSTGNSGMATAGSGDALTGAIAALIAQGMSSIEAAVAGVYLHGLAGDIAAQEIGQHGITAMDIAENISLALFQATEHNY